MKPALFFGYELVENQGRRYKIASPEKAVLDHFYVNPHLNSSSDFAGLRIDVNSFRERIDEEKINYFLEKFSQKRLSKRIHSFLEYMKNA
jgi:hypothetical protein